MNNVLTFLGIHKKKEVPLLQACSHHQWNFITKTYSPPVRVVPSNPSLDTKSLERMAFGVSSYLWECGTCGENKQSELLGSDESPLREVFDKVEKFGKQFVKDEDKTYVVSRYTPTLPVQPLSQREIENLPLR